jgi:hypothetical protein
VDKAAVCKTAIHRFESGRRLQVFFAGVAELADAADLKSAGAILVGSSPTPGTKEMVSNW